MSDLSGPNNLSEFEASIEEAKKDYWNKLVAAGDPDAVAKHDVFCAEADGVVRTLQSTSAGIEHDFEETRQAMMNVFLAHRQGDMEEVARLTKEHRRTMEGPLN